MQFSPGLIIPVSVLELGASGEAGGTAERSRPDGSPRPGQEDPRSLDQEFSGCEDQTAATSRHDYSQIHSEHRPVLFECSRVYLLFNSSKYCSRLTVLLTLFYRSQTRNCTKTAKWKSNAKCGRTIKACSATKYRLCSRSTSVKRITSFLTMKTFQICSFHPHRRYPRQIGRAHV